MKDGFVIPALWRVIYLVLHRELSIVGELVKRSKEVVLMLT
jgi:hypothetical protein